MKILNGTLGVFWSRPEWSGHTFHADLSRLPGEAIKAAVERYRAMFPEDVIMGVKDASGRWVA